MLNNLNLSSINLSSVLAMLSGAKARKVLCILFILLSVLVLALIIQSVIRPTPIIASDALVTPASASNPRWSWFPVVREVAPEPEPEKNEELALASIRAELVGVIMTVDASYAAISTSKNPQGLYGIGDEIENNVTLESVEKDRVIISQRGARRQIPLKPLDDSRNSNQESLIQVNSNPQPSSGFNLSGLVSTTPIQLPGGGLGLKLGNLSNDLTDLADVQEDDVVLSVNGTPISEMLTNPLLWQQFSRQTNMPITIMRGDEEIDLFVNAASLSQKILPRIGAGQIQ